MINMLGKKFFLCFVVVMIQLMDGPFAITQTKRQACSQVLTATSGQFESPNHPGVYDTELVCTWTIEGSQDVTEITIDFTKFDIEWGMQCRFDSVTIKDKAGNLVGGKLCGSGPRKFTVQGNLAVVKLETDDYDGDNTGFKAVYQMSLPAKKGECDFDKPCNDWTDGPGDVNWQTYVYGQSPVSFGPSKDHSGTGGYKYVTSVNGGDKAVLQSITFNKKHCLRFYYHLSGLFKVGTLRVYSQLPGQHSSELWSLSGNHGNMWKEVDVALNSDSEYKVLIEAETGSHSSYDVIAIDDISLVPIEECKILPDCGGDLKGGTGTFTSKNYPDQHPDYSRCTWKIIAPQGTAAILVYFSDFDLQAKQSENFVTVKGNNDEGRTIYGVHHQGVGVKVLGSEAEVIFHSGYNIKSAKGFQARYEAIPFISPDDCDFDNGLCSGWTSNGELKWTANKDTTPSLFTGPYGDTLAIGKYVYIEASHVPAETKAYLSSPQLSGTKCLRFSYSMHGLTMGTVNVYTSTSPEEKSLAWSQSGNHGRKWYSAQVTLEDPRKEYKVIFEGVIGSSFTSDAALDDITFTDGPCPATKECGGYLTSESGRFSSPRFYGSADCIWQIVPRQHFTKVSLNLDINMQATDSCSSNFVQVQDKFGTQIGEKLCGKLVGKSIDINYGGAKVVFHSINNSMNSFKASYKATGQRAVCGGVIAGSTGTFSSPNFPQNYPKDQVCQWEITGNSGSTSMEIFFEYDFAIDDTGVGCAYSHLSLYDQHGNEIKRLCGSTKPLPITIPGRVFTAEFTSDIYQTAKGFKATFVSHS